MRVAFKTYIKSSLLRNDINGGHGTAVSLPINCRDTAVPCPRYHFDPTGNDITQQKKLYKVLKLVLLPARS
jgi:hypothetical protein